MQKSVNSCRNIDQKSRGNQKKQRRRSMNSRFAPTGEHPKANLNNIDHGQHEEQASHHRSNGGGEHPESEDLQINVCPKGLVHIPAIEEINGELEALGDEGGEEEEAEGDDLEDEELAGDVDAGVAGGGILEAVLAGGGQGKADEDGDGEEGVHVDEAVEGRNVDAGGGR